MLQKNKPYRLSADNALSLVVQVTDIDYGANLVYFDIVSPGKGHSSMDLSEFETKSSICEVDTTKGVLSPTN